MADPMIKGGRVVFDQADLDEAGAAIVARMPKVKPGTAQAVARIAFEAIGMESRNPPALTDQGGQK